jgi:hypothetical protein
MTQEAPIRFMCFPPRIIKHLTVLLFGIGEKKREIIFCLVYIYKEGRIPQLIIV